MFQNQPRVMYDQRTVDSNEYKGGFLGNGGAVFLVVIVFLLVEFCIQMGRLSEWTRHKAYEIGLSSKPPITSVETPPSPVKHRKAAH